MATPTPKNSVWAAMSYTPPRGRCNHKASLMSPGCPCLRFMLHPIKAASSFDCDGCGHHASFHSLENPAEDAVRKKWAEQEAEMKGVAGGSKKRKLLTAPGPAQADVVEAGVGGSSTVTPATAITPATTAITHAMTTPAEDLAFLTRQLDAVEAIQRENPNWKKKKR